MWYLDIQYQESCKQDTNPQLVNNLAYLASCSKIALKHESNTMCMKCRIWQTKVKYSTYLLTNITIVTVFIIYMNKKAPIIAKFSFW